MPDEIFEGRRLLPSTLFRRDDVAGYLANLDRALDDTTAELGSDRIGRRFRADPPAGPPDGAGLLGGPGSARGEAFERLVRAFDTLDGSDAFVHPDAMAAVAASEKRAERAALDEIDRRSSPTPCAAATTVTPAIETLFGRIVDAWA